MADTTVDTEASPAPRSTPASCMDWPKPGDTPDHTGDRPPTRKPLTYAQQGELYGVPGA